MSGNAVYGSRFEPDILAYTRHGWSSKQIAQVLGCSRRLVQKVRRANGCPLDGGCPTSVRMCNWDLVIELTRQGYSADIIAAKLGISKRHVVRIRSKTHTNVHPKAPLLTDEEVQQAVQMLDDGMSYAEVSRTLGRAFETIQHRIPGRGWTREQTGEYNSATRRLRKKMDL